MAFCLLDPHLLKHIDFSHNKIYLQYFKGDIWWALQKQALYSFPPPPLNTVGYLLFMMDTFTMERLSLYTTLRLLDGKIAENRRLKIRSVSDGGYTARSNVCGSSGCSGVADMAGARVSRVWWPIYFCWGTSQNQLSGGFSLCNFFKLRCTYTLQPPLGRGFNCTAAK